MRKCGAIPIAPHLFFPQFLDDDNPNERQFGLEAGKQLIAECDELWYFGDRVSKGMVSEILKAKKENIRVVYVPNADVDKTLNGGKNNELSQE